MWHNGQFFGSYYPEWESEYRPIHHGYGRPMHPQRDFQRDDYNMVPRFAYPTPYARGYPPQRRQIVQQAHPAAIHAAIAAQLNPALFAQRAVEQSRPAPRPAGISGPEYSKSPVKPPQLDSDSSTKVETWRKATSELDKVRAQTDSLSQIAGAFFKDFSAAQTKPLIELELNAKVCATQAEITWKTPPGFLHTSSNYEIEALIEGGLRPQKIQLPVWKTCMTMKLIAGTWYTVKIIILDEGKTFAAGTSNFKAIFDLDEMKQMYEKAVKMFGDQVGYRFTLFHRAKPQEYWDHIWYNKTRVMEKYTKDDNGQPASPINGAIKGLFFSGSLKNGQLPPTSFFGELRMTVPAVQLLPLDPVTNKGNNLYFADFYCNRASHYVTIVITVPGSATDLYCQKCLIPLPLDRNPFLKAFRGVNGTEYWVHSNNLWVEIFYTEDIPLHWGEFMPVTPAGPGRSKPGGLLNNRFCTVCNLYPLGVKTPKKPAITKEADKIKEADSADKNICDKDESAKTDELREQLKKLDETLTVDLTGDNEIEEYTLDGDVDVWSEPNSPLPQEAQIKDAVETKNEEELILESPSTSADARNVTETVDVSTNKCDNENKEQKDSNANETESKDSGSGNVDEVILLDSDSSPAASDHGQGVGEEQDNKLSDTGLPVPDTIAAPVTPEPGTSTPVLDDSSCIKDVFSSSPEDNNDDDREETKDKHINEVHNKRKRKLYETVSPARSRRYYE